MNPTLLLREAAAFQAAKLARAGQAQITAARVLCRGVAPGAPGTASIKELEISARRLRHAMRRERLRGVARHRLYDLNRHIALKKTLDGVLSEIARKNGAGAPSSGSIMDAMS